jgi:hypothetical protein
LLLDFEAAMKKNITLRMLNDPGHEWLVVPNDLVREVDRITGVSDRISGYSYITDDRSFFEGDQDADLFVRAATDAGISINIGRPSFAKKSAACRQYAGFNSERSRMQIRFGGRYFCKNIQGGSFVHLVGLPRNEPSGKYVVVPEGESARYGVKPSEFHRVLRSESFGQSFMLREHIEGVLLSKFGKPSPYGRSILEAMSVASAAPGGGVVSLDDKISHEFVAHLVRWSGDHPLPDAPLGHHAVTNIALNALQFDSYQRHIGRESLVDVMKNLSPEPQSVADFLASLNSRVPVPAGHTLDLGGPIVPDGVGGVLFVTSGEDGGQPAFFVRKLDGSHYSELGDCSSLVAVAPTLDAATSALYRRLANDVLTFPKTYANMQLSGAAGAQLSEQMRSLSIEPSDPQPMAEVHGPSGGDDETNEFLMI